MKVRFEVIDGETHHQGEFVLQLQKGFTAWFVFLCIQGLLVTIEESSK